MPLVMAASATSTARGGMLRPMRREPAINPWFLHPGMLDGLLYGSRRARVRAQALHRIRGDVTTYARDLEDWLSEHEVPSLREALLRRTVEPGTLVVADLLWQWSDVARERAEAHAGAPIRSTFQAHLHDENTEPTYVHGAFDPAKLTCSTSNVELRGQRRQWILGQVAQGCGGCVELRPLAIATLLLAPPPGQWNPEWQRVYPRQVDQWRHVDWGQHATDQELMRLADVPERRVKEVLARSLGEIHVPADWGGETSDLYTSNLLIDGRQHSAAFLLKGPARFAPMSIAHLGRNGDQIVRLARTPSQVLVLQHCHRILPEVIAMLEDSASNFHRGVRRFMVLDGYDTYRLLEAEKTWERE